MAEFSVAFGITLGHEGGYSFHPSDKGGETYRGVSRRAFPSWLGWGVIDRKRNSPGFPDSLKDSDSLNHMVEDLYREKFWCAMRCDRVESQALANELFDTAINMGIGRATEILQESLNLLNRGGKNYADIDVDGGFGETTWETMQALIAADRGAEHLLKMLNLLQGCFYVDIMRRSPGQEVFARGWLNRVRIHGPNCWKEV